MNHAARIAALVAIVTLALFALVIASAFAASALAAPDSRPCVVLDLTLYTYDGPIVIDGACVDFVSVTNTAIRISAHDAGDGIFHSDFEGTP